MRFKDQQPIPEEPRDIINGLLKKGQRHAWATLPLSIRPDVQHYLQPDTIVIAPIKYEASPHHPKLPVEAQRLVDQYDRERRKVIERTDIAHYDPDTRQITLSPKLFGSIHRHALDRTLFHEMGESVSSRKKYRSHKPTDPSIIPYTPEDVEHINTILKNPYCQEMQLTVDNTYVVQTGFRQILAQTIDGQEFMVAELRGRGDVTSEVFPTIMEIYTDLMVQHTGNLAYVENAMRDGTLRLTHEHVQFSRAILQVVPVVGFERLLLAFSTGEVDDLFDNIWPGIKQRVAKDIAIAQLEQALITLTQESQSEEIKNALGRLQQQKKRYPSFQQAFASLQHEREPYEYILSALTRKVIFSLMNGIKTDEEDIENMARKAIQQKKVWER